MKSIHNYEYISNVFEYEYEYFLKTGHEYEYECEYSISCIRMYSNTNTEYDYPMSVTDWRKKFAPIMRNKNILKSA